MFRSSLRVPRIASNLSTIARNTAVTGRRSITVPALEHDFSAEGVPELMSAAGFQFAWTDYMTLMTERLNSMTAGTELEDKDSKTIALMTAREPSQAPIFNYASMAHNTHFFFRDIHPTGTPMPETFKQALEASFGSLETLRREFIVTATAMFGPGFVWLVKAGNNDYRILTTYLGGSPYAGAHWRRQTTDMNSTGYNGTARERISAELKARQTQAANSSGLPPGGIDLEPLLCLSTWEHTWLMDYGHGVGGQGGKAAFVEGWWERINWEQVAQRSPVRTADFQQSKPGFPARQTPFVPQF